MNYLYLKLLEEFPLNGYTLSKNSGIPRSRIYEVLKNLIDKQMVFEQAEEKNKLYYPVEPDLFIKKLKAITATTNAVTIMLNETFGDLEIFCFFMWGF